MGLVYNPIHNRKDNKMTMESIMRLMMILVGFIIAMLGVITFIHSGEHRILGLLISFAGVVSMFGGLPDNA
jgi:ABC-type uncharacterized transport system permease subunit